MSVRHEGATYGIGDTVGHAGREQIRAILHTHRVVSTGTTRTAAVGHCCGPVGS